MEFPHSPLWNRLVLDLSSTVTSTGLLHQEIGIVATLYLPERGFLGHLYDTRPGQALFRWLSYSVVPPQPQGEPSSLLVGYRTDQTFATPAERLLLRPGLPPLRSRIEREYQAANRVGTFADILGRNAWEFSWRILGTDMLLHTVRFPTTLQNIRLPDKNGRPFVIPTRDIKLMDHTYPAYTPEGGVPCYVVEAVPKEDWLADSSLSKLVYWLDQRSFFPLRIEQYDEVGKLSLITVRVATHANPQLGERGYAVFIEVMWDLHRDVMTASLHGIFPKEWSEEERRLFFQPNQMSSRWFPPALEGAIQLTRPEEFYLRPLLDVEKFPEERRIELSSELTESILAQEREGRLVFREVQVNGVNE